MVTDFPTAMVMVSYGRQIWVVATVAILPCSKWSRKFSEMDWCALNLLVLYLIEVSLLRYSLVKFLIPTSYIVFLAGSAPSPGGTP